jgi:hypothetical protein
MNDSKEFQKLKEEYYKIEIPSEIDSYVKNGIIKGKSQIKQNKRTNKWIKWAGSSAAIFVSFVISINTIPSFADTICNIPRIGKLVQVLQFNEGSSHGGTITDGTDVEFITMQKNQNNENIIINFTKDHIPKDFANYFRVDYSKYPYTLTFSIPGARQFSAQRDLETLKQSTLIKDAYELITLDDSMIRFSITFNGPVSYVVKEYKNPAQVVIQLSPKKEIPNHKVYSIRSISSSGEELGMLEESLFDLEGVRILKDKEGAFCVEAGYFNNINEANKKMKELKNKYPIVSQFYIEERNPLNLPKHITE